MSDTFNYLVYVIYFIGFIIAIYCIIADRRSSLNSIDDKNDDIVKVYIKKKRCVWNNKQQNISYMLDVVCNEEELKINDEDLFAEAEEGSYIQMKIMREKNKQGEYVTILKKL